MLYSSFKRAEKGIHESFPMAGQSSRDCHICTSAKGLKVRKELVEHMKTHKNNPSLIMEKFADYLAVVKAHESCNKNLKMIETDHKLIQPIHGQKQMRLQAA
jgi:hypothetical protein